MTNSEWKLFLQTSRSTLGKGASLSWASESWCAWTTFSSLRHQLTYWACGLPDESELLENSTVDAGLWTQSFSYSDIAHLVIPSSFYWERVVDNNFQSGFKNQDIALLSQKLSQLNIKHRKTDLVLEIKLY